MFKQSFVSKNLLFKIATVQKDVCLQKHRRRRIHRLSKQAQLSRICPHDEAIHSKAPLLPGRSHTCMLEVQSSFRKTNQSNICEKVTPSIGPGPKNVCFKKPRQPRCSVFENEQRPPRRPTTPPTPPPPSYPMRNAKFLSETRSTQTWRCHGIPANP